MTPRTPAGAVPPARPAVFATIWSAAAAWPRRLVAAGREGLAAPGMARVGGGLLLALASLFWLAVALRVSTPLVLADEYVYAIRGIALDHLDRLQALEPATPNVGNYLFLRLINLAARAHLQLDVATKLFNVACFAAASALIGARVLPRDPSWRSLGVFALIVFLPIGSYVAYVMPESAYLLVFVVVFALLVGASDAPLYRRWALAAAVIGVLTLVKAHGLFVFAAFLCATLTWSAVTGRITLAKAGGLCLAAAAAFAATLMAGARLLGPWGGAGGAGGDVVGSYYWAMVGRSAPSWDRVLAALGFAATLVSAILLLMAPCLTFLVFGILADRRGRARAARPPGDLVSFIACFLLAVLGLVVPIVAFLLVAEPSRLQLRYVDFSFPCILALAWIWRPPEAPIDTRRFRLVAAAVWGLGAAIFLFRLPGLRPLASDSPEMFFAYGGAEFGAFGLGAATTAATACVILLGVLALLHPKVRWLDAQLLVLVALTLLADVNTLTWQGAWSASQKPLRDLGDVARTVCGPAEGDIVAMGPYDDAAQLYTAMARVGRAAPLSLGDAARFDPLAMPPGCAITPATMDPLWGPPLRRAAGLNLYRPTATWRVAAATAVEAGVRPAILGPGWSAPEAHGVWTDGHRATLRLAWPTSDRDAPTVVELDAFAFTPPGHADQRLAVSADGRRLAAWRVRDGAYYVRLPTGDGPRGGAVLVLDLPDAVAPASVLPGVADQRLLGVGLRGVRILQPGVR